MHRIERSPDEAKADRKNASMYSREARYRRIVRCLSGAVFMFAATSIGFFIWAVTLALLV